MDGGWNVFCVLCLNYSMCMFVIFCVLSCLCNLVGMVLRFLLIVIV